MTAARVTPGADLFEQFQPFAAKAVITRRETSDISTRPRQTLDKASANRIGGEREHDRNGARRLQQRPQGRDAGGQNDIRC